MTSESVDDDWYAVVDALRDGRTVAELATRIENEGCLWKDRWGRETAIDAENKKAVLEALADWHSLASKSTSEMTENEEYQAATFLDDVDGTNHPLMNAGWHSDEMKFDSRNRALSESSREINNLLAIIGALVELLTKEETAGARARFPSQAKLIDTLLTKYESHEPFTAGLKKRFADANTALRDRTNK